MFTRIGISSLLPMFGLTLSALFDPLFQKKRIGLSPLKMPFFFI